MICHNNMILYCVHHHLSRSFNYVRHNNLTLLCVRGADWETRICIQNIEESHVSTSCLYCDLTLSRHNKTLGQHVFIYHLHSIMWLQVYAIFERLGATFNFTSLVKVWCSSDHTNSSSGWLIIWQDRNVIQMVLNHNGNVHVYSFQQYIHK